MGEEDPLAKAPSRKGEGKRRGGGFDGMNKMNRIGSMGEREGMRFMVLIPFSKERVVAALPDDLLSCDVYLIIPSFCQ
jgi:hypothetical protein